MMVRSNIAMYSEYYYCSSYSLFYYISHGCQQINTFLCTELVWKVARYTSASPIFFGEFENYVDGGVLANNPCDCGLTAIQNFYHLQGERLLISIVVSVGTGVYPAKKLGQVDAQEFLFFGKHWFHISTLKERATNLITLLANAVRMYTMLIAD